MNRADQLIKEWLEFMAEEERKLDESHKQLVERHKEFMAECERIKGGYRQLNFQGDNYPLKMPSVVQKQATTRGINWGQLGHL